MKKEKKRGYIITKIILLFTILSIFLKGENTSLYSKVLPYFMTLEDPTASKKEKELALKKIIKIGNKIKKYIKNRLKESENPIYLYILEKIKKNNRRKIEKNWSKETYFNKKFNLAKKFYKLNNIKKALKLAQSILILEPKISFKENIKEFIRKCKDRLFSESNIQLKIISYNKYLKNDKKIELYVEIKNKKNTFITLKGKINLILKIIKKDYYLNGIYREEKSIKYFFLDNNIKLSPLSKLIYKVKLKNSITNKNVFREYKIEGSLTRCKIESLEKKWYCKLYSNEIKIYFLPYNFSLFKKNPLQNLIYSLKFGNIYQAFFSSFFLNKSEISKAIPILIGKLTDKRNKIRKISYVILKRYTNKNFSTYEEWVEWWRTSKNMFYH